MLNIEEMIKEDLEAVFTKVMRILDLELFDFIEKEEDSIKFNKLIGKDCE